VGTDLHQYRAPLIAKTQKTKSSSVLGPPNRLVDRETGQGSVDTRESRADLMAETIRSRSQSSCILTVPPADTAPRRYSAVGDMLAKAVSQSLQDLPGGDRCDAQWKSDVAEACPPAWVGSVATERLIPSPFGSSALRRLSGGQHSVAVVMPRFVSACAFATPDFGFWRREWIILSLQPNSVWMSERSDSILPAQRVLSLRV
jgi:hypothetical protein